MKRSKRKPQRGWYVSHGQLVYDHSSNDYLNSVVLLAGGELDYSTTVVGEPSEWFITRTIVECFPTILRADETISTFRLWQMGVAVINTDELESWKTDGVQQGVVTDELYSRSARVIHASTHPVYHTSELRQGSNSDSVYVTDTEPQKLTVVDSPWGLSANRVDSSAKYGIQGNQQLALLGGAGVNVGTSVPFWEADDQLVVYYTARMLLQKRQA